MEHKSNCCKTCGDPLKKDETADGICFTCKELENNRRYRLHRGKGEYAKTESLKIQKEAENLINAVISEEAKISPGILKNKSTRNFLASRKASFGKEKRDSKLRPWSDDNYPGSEPVERFDKKPMQDHAALSEVETALEEALIDCFEQYISYKECSAFQAAKYVRSFVNNIFAERLTK